MHLSVWEAKGLRNWSSCSLGIHNREAESEECLLLSYLTPFTQSEIPAKQWRSQHWAVLTTSADTIKLSPAAMLKCYQVITDVFYLKTNTVTLSLLKYVVRQENIAKCQRLLMSYVTFPLLHFTKQKIARKGKHKLSSCSNDCCENIEFVQLQTNWKSNINDINSQK